MKKGRREHLQDTLKMSPVHCKNIENSNKVTCTQDIFLQTQNFSSDAVIVNPSLHQVRIDNPSKIIIAELNIILSQE